MTYLNCISITQALYFDLFDDIPYKWLKEVLNPKNNNNEYDFEIELEVLEHDREAYRKIKFTFELRMKYDEEKYYYTKKFEKIIEYNTSSEIALELREFNKEEEEEEEEEEEILVTKFEHNGIKYLKGMDNKLYCLISEEEKGMWDPINKVVVMKKKNQNRPKNQKKKN